MCPSQELKEETEVSSDSVKTVYDELEKTQKAVRELTKKLTEFHAVSGRVEPVITHYSPLRFRVKGYAYIHLKNMEAFREAMGLEDIVISIEESPNGDLGVYIQPILEKEDEEVLIE